MMLITLALLCTFVMQASAAPCTAGGGTCRCVPQANQANCDAASAVNGIDVDADPTAGVAIGCQTSPGVIACDNNGLTTPPGGFCCILPPTPAPTPCSPDITSFTADIGVLRCLGDTQGEFVITSTTPSSTPVTASVNSGPPSPSLTVGPPGTGTVATGLRAGSNTIRVFTTGGCSVQQSFTATGPTAIFLPVTSGPVNISNPFCFGGLGRIRLVPATGGNGIYNYSRDNFATQQPDIVFSGLPAGTYTFIAKDSTGCISNTRTITLTQPAAAVAFTGAAVVTPPLCESGTNVTVGGVFGSIAAAATGGTGAKTFSIDGVNFGASPINNVAPGTYTLTARDTLGCAATQIVVVPPATPFVRTFTTPTLPCQGAFVTLSFNPAVVGDTTKVDGVAVTLPAKFSGVSHVVEVTNAAGCKKNFTVTFPLSTAGGPCDDNIITTSGDRCIGNLCTGGCVAPPLPCPPGTIGVQLEANLLLCANVTSSLFGRQLTLTNWAFLTAAGGATIDPQNPDRVSLPELNSVFVGNFTVRTTTSTKALAKSSGATIFLDKTNCFVRFDTLDRKRVVILDTPAPLFTTLTLGGSVSF